MEGRLREGRSGGRSEGRSGGRSEGHLHRSATSRVPIFSRVEIGRHVHITRWRKKGLVYTDCACAKMLGHLDTIKTFLDI